jgi:hypothetical protein
MRAFRFPRSAIFLMSLIFVAVVFAIDQGRSIASSDDSHLDSVWTSSFSPFVFLGVLMCAIGAVGYVILCALQQSGAQRFLHLRTGLTDFRGNRR